MVSRRVRAATLCGLLLLLSTFTHLPSLPLVLAAAPGYEYGDSSADRSIEPAIELSELEYEDQCLPLAEAEWKLISDVHDLELIAKWKDAMKLFAGTKKIEKQTMNEQFNTTNPESSSTYKLLIIKYPGDASLEDDDYEKLISFIGENRALQSSIVYSNGTKNLTREEIENILSHNAKEEEKLKIWEVWHQHFSSQVDEFPSILQLAQKAAILNEKSDVKSYWEMLTGQLNGYETVQEQMNKLTNLQNNFMNFVRKRLSMKYDIDLLNSTSVPAHLLGSLIGNDWTHLALELAPEPDIIFEMRKNFWEKRLMGKYLYKSASYLGKKFLNQVPQSDFWSKSDFKANCQTRLVNFCRSGKIRVSTCSEPSITNYLTAYKLVAKVMLHQMSAKIPILNEANRFSVMEEAVAEFFSLLAASPAWLKHIGLINENLTPDQATKISLTITALDVLPRIAYYVSADKWRLENFEKNITSSDELVSNWWKLRLENEFVNTSSIEVPTFLTDEDIVSNKPYLSKVLGIVVAFQMYQYVMKSTEVRHEMFDKSTFNSDFVWMVKNNSENWKVLIEKYMSINAISVDPMTEYFSDLDYFYENYEGTNTYELNAKEVELEQLERRYRKIANTPTTTTTTTTTTEKPTSKTKGSKEIPNDSLTIDSHNVLLTSEKPVIIQESGNEKIPEEKIKMNQRRAVYAVSAALGSLMVICVIAIFGKRRCTKTPKNRRYV